MGYFDNYIIHEGILSKIGSVINIATGRVARNIGKDLAGAREDFEKCFKAIHSIPSFDSQYIIGEKALRDRFNITDKRFVERVFKEADSINNILRVSAKDPIDGRGKFDIFAIKKAFNAETYYPGVKIIDDEVVETNPNYNYFLPKGWSLSVLKPPHKGSLCGFVFKLNSDKIDEVWCLTIKHNKDGGYDFKPYKMKFINSLNPSIYLKNIVVGGSSPEEVLDNILKRQRKMDKKKR